MTISLAFLAPDLFKAAIEGRLPNGIGARRLCDLPSEWPRNARCSGSKDDRARIVAALAEHNRSCASNQDFKARDRAPKLDPWLAHCLCRDGKWLAEPACSAAFGGFLKPHKFERVSAGGFLLLADKALRYKAAMNGAPPIGWIFSSLSDQRSAARRYWIHHPFIGFIKVGMHHLLKILPIDWGSGFGAMMSRFSPADFPQSDARARRLWQTLRPEAADHASTDAAMRRLWRNVGRTVAEVALLDRLWGAGRIEVVNLEHMHAVRDAKRPHLVAAMHLGNWEVISVTGIMTGYYGASLALILENRFEQRLIGRMRERFGGRMIHATPASGRAIIRELNERGPMVIYLDELARGRVHAPAFGRVLRSDGNNLSYIFRLAKITGAWIVPAYCLRVGDQARFRVTFLPPIKPIDTGNAEADLKVNMANLNSLAEPIIRANLDQWFYALDFEFDS